MAEEDQPGPDDPSVDRYTHPLSEEGSGEPGPAVGGTAMDVDALGGFDAAVQRMQEESERRVPVEQQRAEFYDAMAGVFGNPRGGEDVLDVIGRGLQEKTITLDEVTEKILENPTITLDGVDRAHAEYRREVDGHLLGNGGDGDQDAIDRAHAKAVILTAVQRGMVLAKAEGWDATPERRAWTHPEPVPAAPDAAVAPPPDMAPAPPSPPDAAPLPDDASPDHAALAHRSRLPIKGGLRGLNPFRRKRRQADEEYAEPTTTPYVRPEGFDPSTRMSATAQKGALDSFVKANKAGLGHSKEDLKRSADDIDPARREAFVEENQSGLQEASLRLAALAAYDSSSLMMKTSNEDMKQARDKYETAFKAELMRDLESVDIEFANRFLEDQGDQDRDHLNDEQKILRAQVRVALFRLVDSQLKRSLHGARALGLRNRKTTHFVEGFGNDRRIQQAISGAMRGNARELHTTDPEPTGSERRPGGRLVPTNLRQARDLPALQAHELYTNPEKERGKRTAAQLSARAAFSRDEQQTETDSRTLANLMQAEIEEIVGQLGSIQETGTPDDIMSSIADIITPRLAQQLQSEAEQNVYDRKKSRRARSRRLVRDWRDRHAARSSGGIIN
ncbi:MAG TPA: hypothetical protein VF272_03855 [Candidatus Saccharimonadia bacterium]